MKELYFKPEVDVEEYNTVDVLTISNGGNNSGIPQLGGDPDGDD